MRYVTNCTVTTTDEWNKLMRNAKPLHTIKYKTLCDRIRKIEPWLYDSLLLNLRNPYESQCAETRTHYILVHSMIEYFFEK